MDTIPVPARYGGLIGESVRPQPPIVAIELQMWSGRGKPIEQAVDVSDNLREMSKLAYDYFIICTIIVIVLLSISKTTSYNTHSLMFNQLYQNIYRVIETIVDQENYKPKSSLYLRNGGSMKPKET